MTEHAGVGFVGKLPARADFVRQHIGQRVGSELEHWLQKSAENLVLGKAEFPARQLRFVFSAHGCESAALGVIGKSQDQVGRSFPLAIFTALPLAEAMRHLPALPAAYAAFFRAADALLAQAPQLSLEALREAVIALAPTISGVTRAAQAETADQLQRAAHSVLGPLFSVDPSDALFYALHTFCAATAAVHTAPPPSAATVLDCPISVDGALVAWLDLAQRRLAWRQFCPTLLWYESADTDSRLLLALGAATDPLLSFVVDPSSRSTRLWPLRSQRTEAIERARSGLSQVAAALSAATVSELWSLVTHVTV